MFFTCVGACHLPSIYRVTGKAIQALKARAERTPPQPQPLARLGWLHKLAELGKPPATDELVQCTASELLELADHRELAERLPELP